MNRKKPKIALLVESSDTIGGIQSSASRHIELLREHYEIVSVSFDTSNSERDWAGRVVSSSDSGVKFFQIIASDFSEDNRVTGPSGLEFARNDMRFRSYADHLIEIVKTEEIDLLHAYGQFHQRGVLASFAAAKTGIGYIASFRGVDLETRVFEKMLYQIQATVSSAKAIVVVSHDSEKLLKAMFKPACSVSVIPNHFDPALFESKPVSLPLLEHNRMPVIGCFGKFRRVMGLDFLLKSFDELCETIPSVLLLAGTLQRKETEYYNVMLEKLKHSHQVIRLGYVQHSQILNYVKLCNLVVYPSVSDASPNKILEAMYARVPIVSTWAGGIPEMVENEKEALLVPPRTVAPLTQAMRRILEQPDFAKELAQNARVKLLEKFHVSHELEKWKKVYDEALR